MTYTITLPSTARKAEICKTDNTFDALKRGLRIFGDNPKIKTVEIYDDSTNKREWVLTRRQDKKSPAIWNGATDSVLEPSE